MRSFRRSLVAMGVAAMLPTVVFAAFSAFYLLRVERERVESGTLARSRILMRLVDAQLDRDLAALKVLSSSIHFDIGRWPEFQRRLQRVLDDNPQWDTIVLIDVERGQELFDVTHPFGAPTPLNAAHRTALSDVVRTRVPAVGGIESHERPVTWIYVPVLRKDKVRFALAAALKPQVFQDLLLSFARAGSTAAVTDRDGRFIARTLNYEARIGTPATPFVRDAIRGGDRGFYRGTTYEGLESYTAFNTSEFSGWSAHLAVASASIDNPTRLSFVAAGFAGLGGLLLGGFLIVLVLRDMSERRRAEETLRQSQKMEAIGQLTGGIAHDFNNLLTAIIGNLDLIRRRAAGNERLQHLADHGLEAARRGAKLSSQLLAFSRSQRMMVRPIDLKYLLRGMAGLLTQSVGPAIRVETHIDADARFVMSDPNQLELALLNLAVNARDAMPDGGVLTITARRANRSNRQLPRREYVDLCICDSGAGMTEDVRARAIEPFFTTKPVGQGTGLGLSQVYGVMQESGGALTIDSKVGRGTTVCLTLQAAPPEIAAMPSEHRDPAPTAPKSQSEEEIRVLVVDDDKLVRRFMAESLRNLQYQVVDVGSGAEALELLDRIHFDLLLVDFAMPGMNGAEVAHAAQTKQPGLPILVVSGYADSAAVEAALGSARQLRKPFDLTELGAAVAETLSSAVQAESQESSS